MKDTDATPRSRASEDIYTELLDKILNFELHPGERITENVLAREFGVSRTPVRAVLQRLELEGYVSILPKQGCFIRQIDFKELSNYYQIRIKLEHLALENAVIYMTDRELNDLAALWDPAQERLECASGAMESCDESFHVALAEGGRNPVLVQYLEDINRQIRLVRRLDFTNSNRIHVTYAEHYLVCQHLLQRDLTAAKRVLTKHIQHSQQFVHQLSQTRLEQIRPRHSDSNAPA